MTTLRTPILLAIALCAVSARADVPARLRLADGTAIGQCMLRWLPVDKKYNVAVKAQSGQIVERMIDPDDILQMQVAKPKNWDASQKNPQALLQIANEYKMLQWDSEAGAVLARGLLAQNKAKAAVEACKKIEQGNPRAAWDSPMAPEYWRALLETGATGPLAKLLDKGAQSQDLSVAAAACLLRGDVLERQDRANDALKDGYLRCVFLFQNQPAVRAEALYKAAQAFDKLRKPSYAEKMRGILLSQYGNSPWAQKLR